MKLGQKGRKYMGYLLMRYLPLLIVILLLAFIDSSTYTYVPIFLQYIYAVIESSLSGAPLQQIELPNFLIEWFNSGRTILLQITFAAVALFLFQFLRGILKFITGVYRQFFGETIAKNLRNDMYSHIQSLPYSYHNNVDTGDLIQRCTTDNDVIRMFLSQQLAEIVSVFAVLGFAIYQMSKINTTIMLLSLIIVPIAFISSFCYFIYVQKSYEKIEESEAKIMTILQENIAGVRVIKAFGNEKHERDRFDEQSRDYATKNLKLNRVSSIFWGLSDFTTMLQYLIIIAASIIMISTNTGAITVANVTTVLALASSFIWPIRGLGRTIGDMGKSIVACGRIKEILDHQDEHKNESNFTPIITGEIVFENVKFKFDDTDQHLLDDLSFRIKAGETVAIIGKTGSGKSTIAKLLTRLYDYTDGSVLLNGNELKAINKKYVRHNIGLILQEPFLFTRSVYDNIAITNRQIESTQVYKVAQISAVANDIKGFEKGYNTLVGEKGTTLSGGQKQRLSIARMLINDKPIIIFDDSLSAVDTETDLMIRNALKDQKHRPTTIIITHRITTAKQADKIIVLENGHVSQIGNHESLSTTEGLYKKLWDIQGEIESEFMKILNEEEVSTC